jgi:hypothetical protein
LFGHDTRGKKAFSQQFSTYVFGYSQDPDWIGQKFVLPVPEKSENDSKTSIRDMVVRVSVISKSVVGLNRLIGRTDIQLSCLKDEKCVCSKFLALFCQNFVESCSGN